MIVHETDIRVRYPDTDKMGVVYHAVYVEYMETGRTEWMRESGLAYSEIESSGLILPVLDVSFSMKRPARYDDIVTVRTMIRAMPTVRLEIDYEIKRGDELLTTGTTRHAFVVPETMRPVKPPKAFMELLEREFDKVAASTAVEV